MDILPKCCLDDLKMWRQLTKGFTKVSNTSLSFSLSRALPLSLPPTLPLSLSPFYYCFYCVVSLGALPGRAGSLFRSCPISVFTRVVSDS